MDRVSKTVHHTIRIAFKDGGERGLNNGSKVPTDDVQLIGQTPISTRTAGFSELKKIALEGVVKYWGRNSTRTVGTSININGGDYQVIINAVENNTASMPAINLTYITNEKAGRSRNWELSRITFYNTGYLYDPDEGWYFYNKNQSDISFGETFAHEAGHEILQSGGGFDYSKTHKGTSTLITQKALKGTQLPVSGEIDLMKYAEKMQASNFYERVVASEEDVKSLIWIGGIKT